MGVEVVPLAGPTMDAAAALVAHEHRAAVDRGVLVPRTFLDAATCRTALTGLLTDGYSGVVAIEGAECVGVMCVRSDAGVGFVPAHGVAVDPGANDPTRIVVELLVALDHTLSAQGAWRLTIDHVEHDRLAMALYEAGFGSRRRLRRSGDAPDVRSAADRRADRHR